VIPHGTVPGNLTPVSVEGQGLENDRDQVTLVIPRSFLEAEFVDFLLQKKIDMPPGNK
jgi:hypothetical protein